MQTQAGKRRLFLEALEPRQMMTLYPLEPSLQTYFQGNEYPAQHSQVTSTDAFLSAPSTGNKQTIGLNYLKAHAGEFGVTLADLNHVQITNSYTGANGVTHIYLQQMFNGLPIANAYGSVHVAASGQVISADLGFVPGLTHPTVNQRPTPSIEASSAVSNFMFMAGVTSMNPVLVDSTSTEYNRRTIVTAPDLSDLPIPVVMQYVPKSGGGLELAWKLQARLPDGQHWYEASIGAESGSSSMRVIALADWVDNATYNVFEQPNTNPLDGPRSIVTDPHNTTASPFGWHDTNGVTGPEFTDTRGNNVNAQEDRDNNDTGGLRPNGGTALNFDFPYDPTLAPIANESAAVTNLFYWVNLSHDISFVHGFDEVSGNFQFTNYSGQGLGNDAVEADAQDGSGVNNANFATPPDGIPGRMQQFIFNITTPNRDSDFMGDIIAHEFGHGISNRLTGGPANSNALQALQSGGMGEGWSDWFGLVLDLKPGEDRNTPQPIGNWVLGQPADGPGVRRFPYSYDMSVDPLTLGDFNGGFPNNEVHNAGEIWASALWDLTHLLVSKHGFNADLFAQTGGLQVAMKIVFEGMKLQPANPTFLDARDAILAADLALYGGENYDEIWDAFARRGFGLSADAGVDADSQVVVEAFDRPPPLARVRGTVYQDRNNSIRLDGADIGLVGWTVYVDANNNGQFDTGEKSTVSGPGGTYQLTFFGTQQVVVREVLMTDWKQVFPQTNGGAHLVTPPGRGLISTGVDFGNQELPGEIHGLKYNDLDADGVRDLDDPETTDVDETEPGIPGVVIYVDLNNNDSIGILEPAAVTDRFGRYTIKNVQPGTNYTVREVLTPGMVLTQPSLLDPTFGEYRNVIVIRNSITTGVDFGNTASFDWSDAPTAAQTGFAQSYPTTAAQNGARHGILPGFGLGAVVDGEPDGRPTNASATGDDIFPAAGPDDEDGIVFLGMQPGTTNGSIQVTVSNGAFAAGYLQGWIDWNRDGDWNDPGEQVVTDRLVRASNNPTIIDNIAVPNIPLGVTYARFRYGYERGSAASPTGPALAGEVEDYQINILDNIPVAVDDAYGGPNPPVIRQNSLDNLLLDASGRSVLGNDQGTIGPGGVVRPPRLDPTDFPLVTDNGGTIAIAGVSDVDGRQVLVYTPAAGFVGTDHFVYQVNDGAGQFSNFADVTLVVTAANPIAIDDFVELAPISYALGSPPAPVPLVPLNGPNLMSNDQFPNADTFITAVERVTPGSPAGEAFVLNPNSRTFSFRPAPNFTGTVIYDYTIDDSDPLTAPDVGRVTIQVAPFVGGDQQPAATHFAALNIEILSLDGSPVGALQQGDKFLVRVTSNDLAPFGAGAPAPFTTRNTRGVEAAYLDLQYNAAIASPVSSSTNPFGYNIVFNGKPLPDASGGTQRAVGSVEVNPPTKPAPTTSAFSAASAGLDPDDGAYEGMYVRFTSGALAGQQARIVSYIGASNRFIFDPDSFTAAPGVGDAFSVEAALYDTNQSGALNSPVFGQIDEAGGFHADPNEPIFSVGPGPQNVFSIVFQVSSADAVVGSQFRVVGDPADPNTYESTPSNPDTTRVLLTNRPNGFPNEHISLADEQVFIGSSTTYVIQDDVGGEFSNFRDPLDVNDDSYVTPADALVVIDDLNTNGSRKLSQADIALTGAIPRGFLDVNIDSHVAAVDALMVIDFLNARGSTAGSGSFAGESEGEAAAFGAASGSQSSGGAEQGEGESDVAPAASAGLLGEADGGEGEASSLTASSDSDPLHRVSGGLVVAAAPITVGSDGDWDELELADEESSEAADEVFGELGGLLD